MSVTHRTYCRNCPSVCGLLVETDNNRIVSIRGDREHPLTQGYFCIKGRASQDLHNGEDRLISSKKRMADGRFADIEMQTALDEIHARLEGIVARYGPSAVAMYYGTGANNHSLCHSAMKAWLHSMGSPWIFSSMTLDQSAKWVTMGRMGMYLPGKHSILDADVAMLVGVNPMISHTGYPLVPMTHPQHWLREAKKRGMKLIVVDPRKTETARLADIHLQVRPGEDPALFAGLIRIILDKGWQDAAFCERFVEPLDALRVAVRRYTPSYVAQRTGIAEAQLMLAAETFALAARRSVASGTGPNMSAHSNLAEHLIESLNAICGAYRRAGDRIGGYGALYGARAVHEAVMPPYRGWEQGPKCRSKNAGALFGEYPSALLPDEIAHGGEERIRALFVVGGNPVRALGEPQKALKAFRELELLVTLDPRLTETAAISHYALATSLPYERHDFTGIFDPLFAWPFVQTTTPVIERPAGVVDDWEVFWGLARRAGRALVLKRPAFGLAHEHIPGPALSLAMDAKPDTADIVRWMSGVGGSMSEGSPTQAASAGFEPESVVVQPAAADDGLRLQVCPDDVAQELEAYFETPKPDRRYSLISRRMLETMNSAYRHASKVRERYPGNPIFMNPEDMTAEGLAQGTKVQVRSDHGAMTGVVRADPGLLRGVVSAPHAWDGLTSPEHAAESGGDAGTFTGSLVSLTVELESINYMPRQSGIPVSVTVP